MKITLSKGGTKERTVELKDINIQDLWHIAKRLHHIDTKAVLEVWHLAHDMLKKLREIEAKEQK